MQRRLSTCSGLCSPRWPHVGLTTSFPLSPESSLPGSKARRTMTPFASVWARIALTASEPSSFLGTPPLFLGETVSLSLQPSASSGYWMTGDASPPGAPHPTWVHVGFPWDFPTGIRLGVRRWAILVKWFFFFSFFSSRSKIMRGGMQELPVAVCTTTCTKSIWRKKDNIQWEERRGSLVSIRFLAPGVCEAWLLLFIWNFPNSSAIKKKKKFTFNAGDTGDAGSIPGHEDPLEEEMATHLLILA